MRPAGASAVRRERDRDLRDALAKETRLDDHLRGELHPGALQIDAIEGRSREPAHAAVDVANLGPEHVACQEREHRIAQPAMQPGHGARFHRAAAGRQPATLHQVVSLSQLGDELRDVAEVVAVVRVAHDHVAPARRADAAHQGVAIAACADWYDTRAERRRDLDGAVGAAVVRDDDFSLDSSRLQGGEGLLDAHAHGLVLVEARHDHGHFDRGRFGEGVSAGTERSLGGHGPARSVGSQQRRASIHHLDGVLGVELSDAGVVSRSRNGSGA